MGVGVGVVWGVDDWGVVRPDTGKVHYFSLDSSKTATARLAVQSALPSGRVSALGARKNRSRWPLLRREPIYPVSGCS